MHTLYKCTSMSGPKGVRLERVDCITITRSKNFSGKMLILRNDRVSLPNDIYELLIIIIMMEICNNRWCI